MSIYIQWLKSPTWSFSKVQKLTYYNKSPTDLSRPFWRVPSQKHWLKSPTLGVWGRSPRKILGFSKGNFPDFPLKFAFCIGKLSENMCIFALRITKFPGGCAPGHSCKLHIYFSSYWFGIKCRPWHYNSKLTTNYWNEPPEGRREKNKNWLNSTTFRIFWKKARR